MSTISSIQLRKLLLKCVILSLPYSGFVSFIPLVSITLFIIFLYIIISIPYISGFTRFHQNNNSFIYLLILYGLILGVSIVHYEPNTENSYSFLRQFFIYIIAFYVISDAIFKGLLSLKSIMTYYLIGFAFLSLFFVLGLGTTSDDTGRQTIFGINENKVAIFATVAILFSLNIVENFRMSNIKRFFIYAMIPAYIYLLISTGSRGGVIGLLLAILVYYYYKTTGIYGKSKNIIKSLFFVGILITVFLSNDLLYQRTFLTNNNVTEDRTMIWKTAHSLISDNLFFGVGVFKYETGITKLMGRFRATHNEFLSIWIYSGLIGLSIFIYFIYDLLRSSLEAVRNYQNPLFISLLVLIVFTLFKGGGFILSIFLWVLFALIRNSNSALNNAKPKIHK